MQQRNARSALLGLLILVFASSPAMADEKKKGKDTYRIGLSMYSLRQLFSSGKLHAFDYPKFAKETFGITDIDVWDGGFPKESRNDPKFYKELRKRADSVGSNIFLVMTGVVNANSKTAANPETEAKKFRAPVDQAVILGAKYVRVFLRAQSGDRAKAIAESMAVLTPISDYAKSKGVTVVIEPGASRWSAKGTFLAELAGKLKHSHCRLMPDFGKFEKAELYIGTEAMMKYTDVVSAKSHNFKADGNEERFDYNRLINTVKKAGFTGIVAIEYEGHKLGPVEGVKATQALLKRLQK